MGKDIRNRLLTIIAVIIAALYFTFPVKDHINLGLDLKGGMHLILRVDTSELKDEQQKKDALPRAIEILRNRIDSLGVGEPIIAQQGTDQILVQLPGVTDRDAAIQMIGTTAKLEFHLVNDNPAYLKQALDGNVPEGFQLAYIKKEGNTPLLLNKEIALSGEHVKDARVDFSSQGMGRPQISISFDAIGTKQFADITKANVNNRLAIVLDDEVLSAPNIQEPILSGSGQITGQFTMDEASILALSLRSGSLPAKLIKEEERTIGPLLGKDSISSGINATIIGGGLVFAFMLIYYLTAGIVSNIALLINLLMIFGIMGFLNYTLPESQLTLTLPGIAGIILTLGMAVDANVLINERIREELNNGRPLQAAINNGFSKALKAIVDSNMTTLIAAFMLFQFGSGPIKGFAVTLSIGLISSLFTALFVTKTIFHVLLSMKLIKNLKMLKFLSDTKIDFVSKRFICFALSSILVVVSLFTFFTRQNDAYGIDFAGGRIQEYHFEKAVNADKLRAALKDGGIKDAIIQQFEQYPGNIIIRTTDQTEESLQQIISTLKNNFADNPFEILRVEQVGPVVGKSLRTAALMAIIFALGGILVFVGFRFKHFDFATAGIIALLHDVIVTLGILLLMGRQIDLLVVTALLTIAGYSINDTIIIYDRIRENLPRVKRDGLASIINLSINQTLSRTLLTTITTLMVVVALYFMGGEVLNTFALTLIIGFIAGTYSTIFIASPIVLAWDKKQQKK